MGWKNVKEQYGIKHRVQVTDKGICIGSYFCHNLIVIGLDGKFIRRHQPGENADLNRYQDEMDDDLDKLKRLVESPDHFDVDIPIWTYDECEIVEKLCEVPKWPNCTHDGQMIYENRHSTDRNQVVVWALENAKATQQLIREYLDQARARVTELEQRSTELIKGIHRLESEIKSRECK